MENLKKGEWSCIIIMVLMMITIFLQWIGPEMVKGLGYPLVTTMAGMALVEAVNCLEDGASIGKGVIVVIIILALICGVASIYNANIANKLIEITACIVVQLLYLFLRTGKSKSTSKP